MEQIPIIVDGETLGNGQFRRDGAYMVFSGKGKWHGDMVRLWLYGEGEPVYLGVLIPDGQGYGTVQKRFSMGEYARLPQPVTYCGDAPVAPKVSESQEDTVWYAAQDGTLTRQEHGRTYVAFPVGQLRLPRGGEFLVRQIEGQEYVIFPW